MEWRHISEFAPLSNFPEMRAHSLSYSADPRKYA